MGTDSYVAAGSSQEADKSKASFDRQLSPGTASNVSQDSREPFAQQISPGTLSNSSQKSLSKKQSDSLRASLAWMDRSQRKAKKHWTPEA
mmetsp:Transcript_102894/g.193550  ORF Transcript_102894/g.193550 Transcript_102894/m.193550 type:complete len:90 (+) Transcript_102894:84-353(+)